MDDYARVAGRLLADRYRLPQPPAESYYLTESVAYDTASGQEVLVRQVPLPEVVEAEVLDDGDPRDAAERGGRFRGSVGRATRRPADPAVRRAVEAAVAAASIPDHPRLDQVFDVFVEGDGLWVVSELLPATPLATLLADQTLTAHRAAEIAADLLTALRAVHAHGWTHRNVTSQTVLVCDDGRALLTGLAVGAAQEALCGYNPLPDSGPVPLPPSGGIPGEPRPGGGGEAARPGEGEAVVRPHGGSPATWTGSALPAGFDARYQDEPAGPPEPYGSDPSGHAGAQADTPGARDGGDGPRGIFGLQGLTPDNGPAQTPSSPVRHGYETGGRGPRSGAVAAYQAGARRATARTRAEKQGGSAGGERGGAPSQGAGQRSHGDWWTTAPAQASPGGEYSAPDDSVRWLPSGEDEVSPTDLPGSRPPNSLPVKASWRTSEPEPEVRPDEESVFEDDTYESDDFDPYVEEEADEDPWGADASAESGGPEQFRGPTTALEAERARQARMTVVGAVSERWAPEQAGPVYENWRLAPPVGPSADLWALGALLFRAVQGHAPYPEEDVAELVQMVCAEPPAFAEDCGPLRPVVDSLMRQDPTERPDFEELRGWLRSLVRSAPEPDVGWHTVFAPSLESGGPSDPRRLPILRRRGELVRRRRAQRRAAAAERRTASTEGQRHKRQRPKEAPRAERPRREKPERQRTPKPPKPAKAARPPKPPKAKKQQQGSPRSLGRLLIGLVLLGLTAAVLYAMWFMPRGDSDGASNQQRGSVGGESRPPQPGDDGKGQGKNGGKGEGGNEKPKDPAPGGKAPKGYKLSHDPAGFQVAVPEAWDRRSTTGRGQVRYNGGEIEMVVVNGRDSTKKYGQDPMAYQSDDEPELAAYRASDWASTSGLRRIDVGETAMAEGTFSWRDGGRDVYVRNRAMILGGRYHVLMVMGSKANKAQIDRHFEAVADTYRATGN